MTKDFKRFYVSKAVFLGASMFLASIGMASANPALDASGSVEPAPVVASPQQAKYTIKGVVEDALGPIAGANVVEKGTTNGTITDMDGNFTLEVASNAILVVSYIGYQNQEVPVNGKKDFKISLKEDSQALEEVVVVGYGTQKKVNLTGSVSSVDFEEQALSRPITNVSNALAGISAGVQVMQNSGQPGSDGSTIRIRGIGTLNNQEPLV
nr:carboxypeptidase-like regulatory domain-containing protein [Parabacteroides sp. AF48-14]